MKKLFEYRDIATEHTWDYNDEIIAYYIYLLKEKHTKINKDNIKEIEFSWEDVSDELSKVVGMSLDSISEDIIGCSRGAMLANVAVIEWLITGVDKGRTGPNKYQKDIIKDFDGLNVDEVSTKANDVVDSYHSDIKRRSLNKAKKEQRIEKARIKRFDKFNKNKSKFEMDSDLKKAKISSKSKPLDMTHIDIGIGTEIQHPKFGFGKVISTNGVVSEIDFNGEIKKLANKFVNKFKN